ncbi:hypothetical protein SNEBB_001409 [Seison nebaliae]|nr:hypothetical protein SNEBB_001409 [Seison nebaliae]
MNVFLDLSYFFIQTILVYGIYWQLVSCLTQSKLNTSLYWNATSIQIDHGRPWSTEDLDKNENSSSQNFHITTTSDDWMTADGNDTIKKKYHHRRNSEEENIFEKSRQKFLNRVKNIEKLKRSSIVEPSPLESNRKMADDEEQKRRKGIIYRPTPYVITVDTVLLFAIIAIGVSGNVASIIFILCSNQWRHITSSFLIHHCCICATLSGLCYPFVATLAKISNHSSCNVIGGTYVTFITALVFNIACMVASESYRFNDETKQLTLATFTLLKRRAIAVANPMTSEKRHNDLHSISSSSIDNCGRKSGEETNELARLKKHLSETEISHYSKNNHITTSRNDEHRHFSTPQFNRHARKDQKYQFYRHSHSRLPYTNSTPQQPNYYHQQKTIESNKKQCTHHCHHRQRHRHQRQKQQQQQQRTKKENDEMIYPNYGMETTSNLGQRHRTDFHREHFMKNPMISNDYENDIRQRIFELIDDPKKYLFHCLLTNGKQQVMKELKSNNSSSATCGCAFFGIFIIWLAALIVHMGITLIGSETKDFYNEKLGMCIILIGNRRGYVLFIMWIAITLFSSVITGYYMRKMYIEIATYKTVERQSSQRSIKNSMAFPTIASLFNWMSFTNFRQSVSRNGLLGKKRSLLFPMVTVNSRLAGRNKDNLTTLRNEEKYEELYPMIPLNELDNDRRLHFNHKTASLGRLNEREKRLRYLNDIYKEKLTKIINEMRLQLEKIVLHRFRVYMLIIAIFVLFWLPLFTLITFDPSFVVRPSIYRSLIILAFSYSAICPFCKLLLIPRIGMRCGGLKNRKKSLSSSSSSIERQKKIDNFIDNPSFFHCSNHNQPTTSMSIDRNHKNNYEMKNLKNYNQVRKHRKKGQIHSHHPNYHQESENAQFSLDTLTSITDSLLNRPFDKKHLLKNHSYKHHSQSTINSLSSSSSTPSSSSSLSSSTFSSSINSSLSKSFSSTTTTTLSSSLSASNSLSSTTTAISTIQQNLKEFKSSSESLSNFSSIPIPIHINDKLRKSNIKSHNKQQQQQQHQHQGSDYYQEHRKQMEMMNSKKLFGNLHLSPITANLPKHNIINQQNLLVNDESNGRRVNSITSLTTTTTHKPHNLSIATGKKLMHSNSLRQNLTRHSRRIDGCMSEKHLPNREKQLTFSPQIHIDNMKRLVNYDRMTTCSQFPPSVAMTTNTSQFSNKNIMHDSENSGELGYLTYSTKSNYTVSSTSSYSNAVPTNDNNPIEPNISVLNCHLKRSDKLKEYEKVQIEKMMLNAAIRNMNNRLLQLEKEAIPLKKIRHNSYHQINENKRENKNVLATYSPRVNRFRSYDTEDESSIWLPKSSIKRPSSSIDHNDKNHRELHETFLSKQQKRQNYSSRQNHQESSRHRNHNHYHHHHHHHQRRHHRSNYIDDHKSNKCPSSSSRLQSKQQQQQKLLDDNLTYIHRYPAYHINSPKNITSSKHILESYDGKLNTSNLKKQQQQQQQQYRRQHNRQKYVHSAQSTRPVNEKKSKNKYSNDSMLNHQSIMINPDDKLCLPHYRQTTPKEKITRIPHEMSMSMNEKQLNVTNMMPSSITLATTTSNTFDKTRSDKKKGKHVTNLDHVLLQKHLNDNLPKRIV